MMHARWLALPLAAVTGFTTLTGCASGPAPSLLSPDLHIGTLDQRTRFELDDRDPPASSREAPDDEGAVDTPKQQRRRKLLYLTGIGAMAFGAAGFVAFGVGGRIVQAQIKNGYDDADLMRDREERLKTTGTVMNGLAIGSSVVGLLGLITAGVVYGIDHARCGELRPRRKNCPPAIDAVGSEGQAPDAEPASAPDAPAPADVAPMGPSPAPTGASEPPSSGGPGHASATKQ